MKLGPRVLGDEEFQAQQQAYEEAKKRAFVYGPRVVGAEPAPEPEPEQPTRKRQATKAAAGKGETKASQPENTNDTQSAESFSLAKLEEALEGEVSDEVIDEFLAAEMEREGEPRKGALRLLLKAEQSRGDVARPAIVAELQSALKE